MDYTIDDGSQAEQSPAWRRSLRDLADVVCIRVKNRRQVLGRFTSAAMHLAALIFSQCGRFLFLHTEPYTNRNGWKAASSVAQ